MSRRLRADEGGAFPIFEAVIVAVLIITTIIFFTSLQRPTTATDTGGIDLGRLAADTLVVVRTREFTATACTPDVVDATLEEWVNRTMTPTTATDSCMADAIEDFLDEVLPPGTSFQLRLDNGVEPLLLVPFGAEEPPRAAHAAEVYFAPRWRANWVLPAVNATLEQVVPGMEVPAELAVATTFVEPSTLTCIEAPNGSDRAPDGQTWLQHWQGAQATDPVTGDPLVPSVDVVPAYAPYGVWVGYTGTQTAAAGCEDTLASRLRVGLPDGTQSDWAVYGLQLVVWFGA